MTWWRWSREQPRLLRSEASWSVPGDRREVVMRRTGFELRQARARCHVLEGLAVALAASTSSSPSSGPRHAAGGEDRADDAPLGFSDGARPAGALRGRCDEIVSAEAAAAVRIRTMSVQLSEEQAEQILQRCACRRLTDWSRTDRGRVPRGDLQIGNLLDVLARPERINGSSTTNSSSCGASTASRRRRAALADRAGRRDLLTRI